MFRERRSYRKPHPLKLFALKIREGFLVGLAMDPLKGSPCQQCVELWLEDRKVFSERANLSDIRAGREILPDLLVENNPHVFYEITHDGTSHRMDCSVFPHSRCSCHRANYVPSEEMGKHTNFAFSPITQIRCVRYGTPAGNLWTTSTTGRAPLSQEVVNGFGGARDREASRRRAVDDLIKKMILADLPVRTARGEAYTSSSLLDESIRQIIPPSEIVSSLGGLGAGGSREETTLGAILELAKLRTLREYSAAGKKPMLVVGTSTWVRSRVPFFLLQSHDLHFLFYPNSSHTWVVGLAAFPRLRTDEKPIFVYATDMSMVEALDKAIFKVLQQCRPPELGAVVPPMKSKGSLSLEAHSKLNLWWTHWLYSCPKISLKDLLYLESYSPSLEHWKEYFSASDESISITPLNNDLLPEKLRALVAVRCASMVPISSNVNGIGTWAQFNDSLLGNHVI